MTRIAVIGGGRIGEALIAGLLESGRASKDLVVVETVPARAEFLVERFGIRVTDSIADAATAADLLVIAVKPHDVDAVLTELGKVELDNDRDQVLVSLAAGVTTARLESKMPAGFPVVRVMPNTPMLVGQGMSVLASGRYAKAEQLQQVAEVLAAVGKVVTVPESQMDAVTAVSGSGPAYFFLVVEAMVEAGVGLGLTRDVATQLVAQTMLGSAALLDESGQDAVELRAAVTSPAGTTAAAVRELERGGVRSAFWEALHAAKRRSVEQGSTGE
ncbi:pyrroline-5-carboxylate reductase [Nocardia blacklockiae]|uniref:pyrroline-5-carboxylate reductase n=1 Tax=Nocardia blacklockiae TaxID=480036 RepID=UPI00189394CB|nr:pyrroline-5-carboxylate reductase [Nocardia blacklockiae]MBF6172888.1 pyrroline-5-carboxylate reductase [Nocardia blacklockiae]